MLRHKFQLVSLAVVAACLFSLSYADVNLGPAKERTALFDLRGQAVSDELGGFNFSEKFELLPQLAAWAAGDNPWFELEGTGAADGDAVYSTGGGVELEADGGGGSADDEAVLVLGANQAVDLGIDDGLTFSTLIYTDSSITEYQLKVGLASNSAGNGPADGTDGEVQSDTGDIEAVFTFDTDDGDTNWQVNYVVAGAAEVEVDTGVAVTASTHYRLDVEIDGDQKARFYINGALVYSGATALGTGVDLGPVVGVSALSAADRHVTVRWIGVAKDGFPQ